MVSLLIGSDRQGIQLNAEVDLPLYTQIGVSDNIGMQSNPP